MGKKPHILVLGSEGQLGSELYNIGQKYPDKFDFKFANKNQLTLSPSANLKDEFSSYEFTHCINCAAYTAVDMAESEKEVAFKVNAFSVMKLAEVCRLLNMKIVHISTDYVFDGSLNRPYKENDTPNPINVYGASKLMGEGFALTNADSIVIRSSWLYSSSGKNFVKTMYDLMKVKHQLQVVNDQKGCPTYAADLAEAILQIIGSGHWSPGIYHYCNEGIISWYEFAVAIKELTGSTCKIEPIPTSQFPTAAKRPAYSALDTQKIKEVYGIEAKDWKASLARCISKIL